METLSSEPRSIKRGRAAARTQRGDDQGGDFAPACPPSRAREVRGFAQISNSLTANPELKGAKYKVLSALLGFCWTEAPFWIHDSVLAFNSGHSYGHTRRALYFLRDAGYIQILRVKKTETDGSSNRMIRILVDPDSTAWRERGSARRCASATDHDRGSARRRAEEARADGQRKRAPTGDKEENSEEGEILTLNVETPGVFGGQGEGEGQERPQDAPRGVSTASVDPKDLKEAEAFRRRMGASAIQVLRRPDGTYRLHQIADVGPQPTPEDIATVLRLSPALLALESPRPAGPAADSGPPKIPKVPDRDREGVQAMIEALPGTRDLSRVLGAVDAVLELLGEVGKRTEEKTREHLEGLLGDCQHSGNGNSPGLLNRAIDAACGPGVRNRMACFLDLHPKLLAEWHRDKKLRASPRPPMGAMAMSP